jgi:hypothetical protein
MKAVVVLTLTDDVAAASETRMTGEEDGFAGRRNYEVS